MTRLIKLGSWSGAAGTVILSALTHTVPVLIYTAAGLFTACMGWLSWILCDDRRVERLNLLLRGGRLPPVPDEQETSTEIDLADQPAPYGPVQPEPDSPIDPQARAYITRLRRDGRLELADEVERALSGETDSGQTEGSQADMDVSSRSEGGVT